MTPDHLKEMFNGHAIGLTLLWGLIHKHVPQLAKVPNALIPWVGALGYILPKLAVSTAQAQTGGDPLTAQTAMHTMALGGWQAIVAAQIYERFMRPWLDHFGIKKASHKK